MPWNSRHNTTFPSFWTVMSGTSRVFLVFPHRDFALASSKQNGEPKWSDQLWWKSWIFAGHCILSTWNLERSKCLKNIWKSWYQKHDMEHRPYQRLGNLLGCFLCTLLRLSWRGLCWAWFPGLPSFRLCWIFFLPKCRWVTPKNKICRVQGWLWYNLWPLNQTQTFGIFKNLG